jgi:PAS domain S-box-containing protein
MTEGLLRQLLDHAVNLCVVMDREGAIIYVNRAFEELFGDPDSTLTGKSIFPMLHPDDVASLQLSFGQAFEKPDEKNLTTFRLKHRQGAWRILEASCWAVIDSAPAPRLLVSAHDVTHRVEAQQAMLARSVLPTPKSISSRWPLVKAEAASPTLAPAAASPIPC